MHQKRILHSELKTRFQLYEHPYFKNSEPARINEYSTSYHWLQLLLEALEAFETDSNEIYRMFSTRLADMPTTQRDRIRWELTRIPTWFVFERITEEIYEPYRDITLREKQRVKKHYHVLNVGSEDCPEHVFPPDITPDMLTAHTYILLYYPLDLAEKLELKTVKTWTEKESIVDWVYSIATSNTQHPYDLIKCERNTNGEICCTLTMPTPMQKTNTVQQRPMFQKCSPKLNKKISKNRHKQ